MAHEEADERGGHAQNDRRDSEGSRSQQITRHTQSDPYALARYGHEEHSYDRKNNPYRAEHPPPERPEPLPALPPLVVFSHLLEDELTCVLDPDDEETEEEILPFS